MGKHYSIVLIALVLLLAFSGSLEAQTSKNTLTLTGNLYTTKGKASAGTHAFLLTIYDGSDVGANVLFEEQHNVTVEKDGSYTILIGTGVDPNTMNPTAGIPQAVFDSDNWYLGIKINTDNEMVPRTQLNAVPYAINSGALANLPATDYVRYADTGDFSGDIIFSGESTFINESTFDNDINSGGNNTFSGTNDFSGDATFAGIVDFTGTVLYNGVDIHDIYVNVTGDTMTGTLELPTDGLVVGTDQLVANGGNIGIGTSNPTSKLHVVDGNSRFEGGYLNIQNSMGYYTRIDGNMISSNSNIYINAELAATGGVRIGYTNRGAYGTIRWSGSHYQGYKNTGWTDLDTEGGGKDKIATVDFVRYGYTSNAIQQAVNSLGYEGGKVYVPSGTYTMTSTIYFNYDNITVEGAGYGTILRWSSPRNGFEVYRRYGIVLRNMYFQGYSYSFSYYAVYWRGAKNSKVEDCWFNNWYYALYAYASSSSSTYSNEYNIFSGNHIYYCRYGINAYGYSNSTSYRHFRYNTIVGNIFDMRVSSAYGIYMQYSQDNTITGNVFYQPYYGIHSYYGYNNVISSNTIKYASQYGINLEYCYYNSVTGNTLNDPSYYGIRLYRSYDNDVNSNNIYSSNNYGIHMYYAERNNIAANSISNCFYGIYLERYCNENNISGNKIYACSYYSIYVYYSQHNSINGNNLTQCNNHGIYISSSCNYTQLTSNKIWGNNYMSGYYGIYCPNNYNISINDNNIYYFYYGMYVTDNYYLNLTGNMVSNSYYYGYYLRYNYYSNISVNTNYYSRNGYGYYVYGGSYTVVNSNNSYQSSGYGFYIRSGSYITAIGNNAGGYGFSISASYSAYNY